MVYTKGKRRYEGEQQQQLLYNKNKKQKNETLSWLFVCCGSDVCGDYLPKMLAKIALGINA
jgi:heme oxygenase